MGGATASYICLHLGKSIWNYQSHQKLVWKWSKPPTLICPFSSLIFITQHACCYSFPSSISTPETWKFRLQAREADHVVVPGELKIIVNCTIHLLIFKWAFSISIAGFILFWPKALSLNWIFSINKMIPVLWRAWGKKNSWPFRKAYFWKT